MRNVGTIFLMRNSRLDLFDSSISDKIESIVFAGRTLHVQEAQVPVNRVDYGPA